MHSTVTALADRLMRSVVAAGCIRREVDSDASLAVDIMRQELKGFLTDAPKYADERELAKSGREALAFASLVAECINRICRERAAALPFDRRA